MSKHYLSKKDIKHFQEKLSSMGLSLPDHGDIQVDETKGKSVYYLGRNEVAIEEGELLPTPAFLNIIRPSNRVIKVDKGAVPHILNGANVFARGILSMSEDIRKDDYVFIADQDGRFIATGKAMVDYDPQIRSKSGEAVRTFSLKQP